MFQKIDQVFKKLMDGDDSFRAWIIGKMHSFLFLVMVGDGLID